MDVDVPDQPLATRVLRGVVSRPHVPQQFLMFGPPGTGKRAAALALAHHLMGTPADERGRPHLDLSVVRASGQQILLEDLEEALRDLAARPVGAACRVVIVEGAERLNNPTVGNRLLKPLEEPPPGSRVILVTDRAEDLLSTLRSRCVPVPFRHPGWRAVARRAADEGEILTVVVARALRRSGLGWKLMDAVLRELHAARAQALFLEVDESNAPALALYRRLGFREVGRRPSYYDHAEGKKSAALVMRRDLR